MSISETKESIRLLPPVLIDKISAGEVIEGPASVIKELVENALDAQAKEIFIYTEEGGIESICVEDNGQGMSEKDLSLSIKRHATSKIFCLEDLEKIHSLGFRGEALAAIASISYLEIKSSQEKSDIGSQLNCRGGEIIEQKKVKYHQGTSITVKNLFYSTPARKKYLKAKRTENSKNHKEIIHLALANYDKKFSYFRDGKDFASYPRRSNTKERICDIYEKKIEKFLLPIEAEYMGLHLTGYISTPEYTRATREGQHCFINQRSAEIKNLSFLIKRAYEELLSPGMHPYYFLFFEIDPSRIDVNVHPQKKEVRILDQSLLQGLVYNSVHKVLRSSQAISIEQVRPTKYQKSERQEQSIFSSNVLKEEVQFTPAHIMENYSLLERGQEDRLKKPSHTPSYTRSDTATKDTSQIPYLPSSSEDSSISEYNLAHTKSTNKIRFQRHFGTLFGVYILAQGKIDTSLDVEEKIYIIDQHTAHERVNYEKNLRKLKELCQQRQSLLEPLVVHCLEDELKTILSYKEKFLKDHGILLEAHGPKSYIIREIPPYIHIGNEIDVITHLIHKVIEGNVEDGELYKEYAAMRACKASIKKNDQLSNSLLAEILQELPKCQEPYRCPHGRPTMIQITRKELDRMFQR